MRQIPTTVLHLDYATEEAIPGAEEQAERTATVVHRAATSGGEAAELPDEPDPPRHEVDITLEVKEPGDTEKSISEEAKKGYGLLFIGREPASEKSRFTQQITRSAVSFGGPSRSRLPAANIAVTIPGRRDRRLLDSGPHTGTATSRHGAELAIALVQGSRGTVTALHVAGVPSFSEQRRWGAALGAALAPDSSADAAIRDIVDLGKAYGVDVKGTVRTGETRRTPLSVRRAEVITTSSSWASARARVTSCSSAKFQQTFSSARRARSCFCPARLPARSLSDLCSPSRGRPPTGSYTTDS